MPSKNLTLGLGLLIAGVALAHHQTYQAKGDTSSSDVIGRTNAAGTSKLSQNDFGREADLDTRHVFPLLGATLISDRTVEAPVPAGEDKKQTYTLQKGDNDVNVAKRLGVSLKSLHLLNPGVKWSKLQIGQTLVVSSGKSALAVKVVKPTEAISKSAAPKSAQHVVRNGENDWIIAHRAGITTVALRALNPGVDVSKLHIGQKINVPGSVSHETPAVASRRIRSRYAVVTGDAVSIRRDASRSAGVITRVDAGTRVTVLDREGDWYRLRFPHGTEGWVRGDFLKSSSAPKASHPSASSTYVASKPRKSSKARGSHYQRGVSQAFVASTNDKSDASSIIAQARSMRGVRYRWGAMSRSATDCSGFTSQVFKSQGYKIPRTSSEQATAGIPVHSKDLKPGDLVFFHTRRGARVTHVGIYMGKGKFIHASSGGGHVQVNSLSDGYYKERLVAARRVAKPAVKKTTPKAATQVADKASIKEPAKEAVTKPTTQPSTVKVLEPDPEGK